MNFDEFETRLRRAAPREIPAEWRREILSPLRDHRASAPWWQQWLWPHPIAWAGLAAVWGAILALHFTTISEPTRASAAMVHAPDMMQAFQERTRLMAELSEDSPRSSPPSAVDRPRSSRSMKQIVV
jgi:hypothetical protein